MKCIMKIVSPISIENHCFPEVFGGIEMAHWLEMV